MSTPTSRLCVRVSLPAKMKIRISPILRVIDTNDDILSRDIEPLVWYSLRTGLGSELLEVGSGDVRWRPRLVTLQHHVEEGLDVHELMLEADPDGPAHMARDHA